MERALESGLPPRLEYLLDQMHRAWRSWMPRISWPVSSVGFASGGSVSDFEDLEDEIDGHALRVTEAAFDDLNPAERLALSVAMGWEPSVWTVREGVLEVAIEKMQRLLRKGGVV